MTQRSLETNLNAVTGSEVFDHKVKLPFKPRFLAELTFEQSNFACWVAGQDGVKLVSVVSFEVDPPDAQTTAAQTSTSGFRMLAGKWERGP